MPNRGDRLRVALEARRVNKQQALAAEPMVHESAISRWKNNQLMSLQNAVSLATALDISLDWLLLGRGSMEMHKRPTPRTTDTVNIARRPYGLTEHSLQSLAAAMTSIARGTSLPGLTITISAADVQRIQDADQRVTPVRTVTQVTETSSATDALVPSDERLVMAWQVFRPWPTNLVTWTDDQMPFASLSQLGAGAAIGINAVATSPANPGSTATLTNNVFTYAQGSGVGYALANASDQDLLMGLAASATVNGSATAQAPICVATVLDNEVTSFRTTGEMSVLLSSCTAHGSLLPFRPGWCTVTLAASDAQATVAFDSRTSAFQLTTGE